MALARDEVRAIADYAHIALTEAELDEMHAYLNDALVLLEPLRAMGQTDVAPTVRPEGVATNVMAGDVPDAHGRALGRDAALGNASSVQERFFCVPSILGPSEGEGR